MKKLLVAAAVISAVFLAGYSLQKGVKKSYDAQEIADLFYQMNAQKVGQKGKINHSKGFCVVGEFVPEKGVGERLGVAFLAQEKIPVLARFSLGGAAADDKAKGRGLALKMGGAAYGTNGGEAWEMAMTNTPTNFAKDSSEFYQWFAMGLPGSALDAAKLKKEVKSYRDYLAVLDSIGVASSFAHNAFHSNHAFGFNGKFARWKFVPKAGEKYESDPSKIGSDSLRGEFATRLSKGAASWDMVLVYANSGDALDNTAMAWSGAHKEVKVGELNLRKMVDAKSNSACNSDVFMPAVLPAGVEAPKDPLFDLRNEVYAITFSRRQ